MAANITPLGDRVIVEPIERDEMTASGIVLPETAKEKPQEGSVIAVGAGKKNDDGTRVELDIAVGDRVIYAKYAGTEFKLDDDRKVLILKESDILAKVA
ncbi:MAG TPA: co-chaperone GroES [Ardenticatenaceae bacterium]|nr:co-chaperone GroES [Ardenticatenaceae bacterium]